MLQKLESAIKLLKHYDTRAGDALQKLTKGIFVFGTAGAYAQWNRNSQLVLMREEYVTALETSTADVAATLVHEATHAWLEHLGFQYTAPERARIEAICYRRALRFARRLPAATDLVAKIERQLTRDPNYLTNDAFRERIIAELKHLGIPDWVVRLLDRSARCFWRLRRSWKSKQ